MSIEIHAKLDEILARVRPSTVNPVAHKGMWDVLLACECGECKMRKSDLEDE